ncbi:MAG: glycosyltransferase, partial [Anaerolineae bacterium]|nr:glycosyltransferase [Anaerolineae bacterium]
MSIERVSVIVPSYNQGRYVAETVESVLAQTYPHVEIIVVDDGSTDDTRERLSVYAPRILCISQPNKGLSGARNTGLAASRGRYVLFLDSDDLLLPTALEKLASILDQDAGCGLAYCAWRQISADGQTALGEVHPRQSGHVLKALLLRDFFFFGSSALIRREALERVGPFDESLPWGDDADMWLRIAHAGYTFGYLDEAVLKYRVHTASMTAAISSHQIEGWQAGLRKFFAQDDLPSDVRTLEPQAYAILYFETAGRYFRGGDTEAGVVYLRMALQRAGTPSPNWFL